MRFCVLLLLCLIAVIAYVQRTGVNAVKAPICDDVGIDTEQFGAVGSAWLLGYTIMQLPTGWLADRFGSRNVLAALAILWSILTALIGLCTSFESLLGLWFAMGLALAGIFPCAAKAIGAWFPDTEKAFASGLLGSSTMLGNAAASLLTSWLVFQQKISWQTSYVWYGAAGVVWTMAFFMIVPERSGSHKAAAPMTQNDWRRMLVSAPLWLLCGQQFFRAGAMIFFINWFPIFLQEERGLPGYEAGVNASCVTVQAMMGGILGGAFSDWVLRRTGQRRLSRQGIAVIGMATAGGLVIFTYFLADIITVLTIFSIAAFIATFGGVSGYTVAIEFGGTRIGIVFSMMNMCGNLGATIVNQSVGSLKQHTGSWNTALFAIAGIFFVDAICWALLNPKRPLFEDHHDPR